MGRIDMWVVAWLEKITWHIWARKRHSVHTLSHFLANPTLRTSVLFIMFLEILGPKIHVL